MSYLTQSQTNRPAAILGVIVVHAGLAALVVAGLTVAGIVRPPTPPIIGVQLPPAPPPPDPQVDQTKEPAARSVVYVPPQPDDLTKPNFVDTVIVLPPLGGDVIRLDLPPPEVGGAGNSFTPAQAAPRNDPARWVTDSDYRSRWIREGLQGTANFRLEIAANGQVNACKITRSTGHAALDLATCELITRRARFTPATDGNGAAARGVYTSSIRWQLPD
ncbi:MAG: hypothetical protein APF82_07085 [Sphingomonadales bacterium BRH_c42]|nr:MAG: hypothetical protein APF82_07085 [Sphingomonadales bacterium BRH_c42]